MIESERMQHCGVHIVNTGRIVFRFESELVGRAMNGATLAEIAEVLGHKTLQMVKRYSHLTEQHTSRVVERMNRQIFGE